MRKDEGAVTLEGIYVPRMLGRFKVIRGFATLQDLARVSRPVPMTPSERPGGTVQGNQRPVDEPHAEAIKRYLETGSLRFIPEVILCVRADYETIYDKESREVAVRSQDVTGLSITPTGRFSRTGGVTAILEENDDLSFEPNGEPSRLQMASSPNAPLPHRIQVGTQIYAQDESATPVIRRLDGNHRLHLALSLAEESTDPLKYLAPFCLVLLGPVGDTNSDYVESMLFHTLNSTALPLQSEHALHLVLGQPEAERVSEADEFATNPELFLTRKLKEKADAMHHATRRRLSKNYATTLNGAAKVLLNEGISSGGGIDQARTLVEDFAGALSEILPQIAANHGAFCKSDFFPELVARCWLATGPAEEHEDRVAHAVLTLNGVSRWLGKNSLDTLEPQTSLAQQVFSIFHLVQRRLPKKVFLARWYPGDTDGEEQTKANLRLEQLHRCLEDLKAEGIPLDLVDMGTTEGGTFPIHQRMYEQIDQSDIVLIDLSGVRPNACIEAGYALANHDRDRLLFLFQATNETPNNPAFSSPPFDLSTFRYERVRDAAEVPNKLTPHLRTIWQSALNG